MFEIKTIILTLMVILLNSGLSCGEKHECQIFRSGTLCYIDKLNLTTDDYNIEPVANNPNAVQNIELDGTVPIFSAQGICEALPYLKHLSAEELSIEKIAENAFQGCIYVKYLHLRNNNLIKLEENAFNGLSNLELLFLTSNNFFDINVESIVKSTPKLNQIDFSDSHVKCSRIREIIDFLGPKRINFNTWGDGPQRTRDYTLEKIRHRHCLSDAQWEVEFAKLSVEQQALVRNDTTTRKPITLEELEEERLDKGFSYVELTWVPRRNNLDRRR